MSVPVGEEWYRLITYILIIGEKSRPLFCSNNVDSAYHGRLLITHNMDD